MARIEGYDHEEGQHCGTGALSNLAAYYDWGFDEAACFGLGTGLGFLTFDHPNHEWDGFLGRPPWTEIAFFNVIDVSHYFSEGEGWDTAWNNLTTHIDMSEPVLLYLDPADLDYLSPRLHPYGHTVVAVGYDEDSVLVSDARREELFELPRDTLREAWTVEGVYSQDFRHTVVTDPDMGVDEATAANRALRETTEYMLDPVTHNRTTGAFGQEHGVPALRSLAADMPGWARYDDADAAAKFARQSIRRHGGGSAYRGLYADALEQLAAMTDVGVGQADRMRAIADEWESVAAVLDGQGGDSLRSRFEEAASILEGIAEQEAEFFADVQEELDIRHA